MNILITGGTGLIGSALTRELMKQDHQITIFSRRPEFASKLFDNRVEIITSLNQWNSENTYEAVINLAGEPIVGARWTDKRKQTLWDSRVTLTEKLVERISQAGQKPTVFISGSAIGYYGDTGDSLIDETSPNAHDFGAKLCHTWEQAALKAETLGVRTCVIRTGLVLSDTSGVLKQMSLPFKFGLGSRISHGKQWMSWIHIDDQIAGILHLLANPDASGPYNFTAPEPINNKTFTASLAAAVNRPAFMITPGWVIKLLLGESAYLLLGGQKVVPSRLKESGFSFKFDKLSHALSDLLKR